MKHQYFGDINDYRKYGLLRLLAIVGRLRLGVSWMLTPPDHGRDGGKIGYLEAPQRWLSHDRRLFRHLAASVAPERPRDLGLIETKRLIPRARYHTEVIAHDDPARQQYLQSMLDRFQDIDLVFFDPDNGLEVPSCHLGQTKFSKYLAWDEVGVTFKRGFSLLIYQHYSRVEREAFARVKVQQLENLTGATCVPIRTAHALFLLVLHPEHIPAARRSLEALDKRWPGQFRRSIPGP
jgi:hypothetical protein